MSTEERFEKIEAAIRDLIVVSRTLLDSQKEVNGQIQGITGQIQGITGHIQGITGHIQGITGQIQEITGHIQDLREGQKHTDELFNARIQAQMETEHKVTRLADTVEKLVRSRGPNGQAEG